MKKHVYRVGDTIRILRPRVVERVGYPKSVSDYLPEKPTKELFVAELLLGGMALEQAIKQAGIVFDSDSVWKQKDQKINYRVEWLSAYLAAKNDGFGGKTRSIHFKELNYWPGSYYSSAWPLCADPNKFQPFETKVLSKRRVVTGEYFAPYSSYDSYTGEYDSEPGGLGDEKHHVIIMTQYGEFHTDDIEPVKEKNESTPKNH